MKKVYSTFLLAIGCFFNSTFAQISLTTPNGSYSQNFNGMGPTGVDYPDQWTGIRYSGSGAANQLLSPVVSDGSLNSGAVYNVGKTDSTDRALGVLASGSTAPAFGVSFTNNTGSVLGTLSLSGFSEQWRTGSNNSQHEIIIFEYSTDATSLSTGTWTRLPDSAFSLREILTTTTSAGAVDGNINRTAISGTINAANIASGSTFWLRWRDADNTGSDGLFALDDFTMQWTNIAMANTVSVTAGNNAAEPSTNGSFVLTLNNPAPAGGVTVMYTLSGNATSGTDYTHPQNGTVVIPQGATTGSIDIVVVDDNLAEPTKTLTATINGVSAGYSVAGGNASISILDNESVMLYSFDFTACTGALSDGFSQQSVTGDQVWSCTPFGRSGNAVQMNGFASSAQVNEDWLISPSLNLSSTLFPLLSFYSRSAFNGAPLQLFITTNFTGDVTTTTWTELSGGFPAAGSDVWTLSENINLSAYKQPNVHIAFKYTSTTAAASRWTLDDINILNSATAPPPELVLPNSLVDFRYTAANDIAIGKPLTFAVKNPASGLVVRAPENFLLSKNNLTYTQTLTYSTAELAMGPRTLYIGFRPSTGNTIYSGMLSFTATGINTQRIFVKGNTYDLSSTLNVVNWNLEWFGGAQGPSDDNLQEENARKAMNFINADVYALTEIVDTARLGNLVRSLDSSYAYVVSTYTSSAASPSDPNYATGQKLALVYKTSVVSNVSARGLMKSSASANTNWASGRVPLLVNTVVNKNGGAKNLAFIVVHGKAGSTQSDYQSRRAGTAELKDTLDTYFSTRNVIILGDFNDDLDQSIYTGGGGNLSSYDVIVRDSVDGDHYKSISLLLSQYGLNSTVGFSDVIDHVVVSNEIFPHYLPLSVSLYNDLANEAGIFDYANTTSDHYPVLSRFFITGIVESPLPVKLTEFTGTKQGEAVRLAWKTASEQNTKAFVVERSADGVRYHAIGTVAAAGNSSSEKAYQLLDQKPLPGANFYRLVSVDRDGKTETSRVVRINFGRSTVVTVWPNPARTQFTVTTDGNRAQLQVVDMAGKVVKAAVLVNPVETISTQGLSKGTYLVRVLSNDQIFIQKLVVE